MDSHKKGKTMRTNINRIIPLVAAGAVAAAIAAAPVAAASDADVQQTPGNVQIVAGPSGVAQQAGQLQEPFGGYTGALLFHNH
jgi:hypothetical protein